MSTVKWLARMYVRAKEVEGATYYQVVQGFRDATGRVRHRTLASLGQYPTIPEALRSTERELRRVRRDLDFERKIWPASSTRPQHSVNRLAALERRLARKEEKRQRLRTLLEQPAAFDTTERKPPMVPPETVSEAYVGRDRATLIGMSDGIVDVITTVRGEHRTTWLVPQDEVAETLRAHRFTLRHAVWSEPRPLHGSR